MEERTPPAGRLAARYVLHERIASGGMASVWRAEDEVLARPVAVKVLHEDLARDQEFLERFRREAVAAARLSHPRIVRIYDTGTDGEDVFIVMELFDGEDLGAILSRGALEPGRAAWIVSCALDGLGHAHERGLVHRDVKPGNILVGRDGEVKVTDFGVAKAATDLDLTQTGRILGSVRYLSPEQVEGGDVGPSSDLYSAGLVLYEALTGRPAFDADYHLAAANLRLSQDPMPPRAVRAGISRELERVTLKALARDPAQRFASAEEMRLALGRALGDSTGEIPAVRARPPQARRAPAPAHEGPSFFRSWMLVPLVLLTLTAIAVVIGLLLGGLELGGPLGVRPAQDGARGAVLGIARTDDVDPEGDGRENGDETALAVDDDPATAWETERYDSAPLGGLKSGVGLLLELNAASQVSSIEIDSPLAGWTFEVRAADSPNAALSSAPRSDASGETSFPAAGGTTRLELEPFRARVIVVWITGLAASGDGFRAVVGEVRIRGSV
ncbi:MAG: protein kinase [Actinomycetota bacterium]